MLKCCRHSLSDAVTCLLTELDLIPGVGTFVLCLTLPLELGILSGVVVNIIFILYHAARPKFSVEMLKVSFLTTTTYYRLQYTDCEADQWLVVLSRSRA